MIIANVTQLVSASWDYLNLRRPVVDKGLITTLRGKICNILVQTKFYR
ncbi:MAG TPA: hypothetical protein V6D03_02055 [Candidatus Caenarcaniphilales bacterium]